MAHPRAVALGTARVEAEQSADPAQRADRRGAALPGGRPSWSGPGRRAPACRGLARSSTRPTAAAPRCSAGSSQDGLADSRAYDALTGLSRAAGGVGGMAGSIALVPRRPPRPSGCSPGPPAATRVLTDTAVKVGLRRRRLGPRSACRRRRWPPVAASAVLKRGALATNPAARAAATRTERRLLRHTTSERLRLGAVAELRQVGRTGAKRPLRPFRPTRTLPTASSPIAAAHWLAEQVVGRAQHAVRVRWLDDLALATRDPARSRTMLLGRVERRGGVGRRGRGGGAARPPPGRGGGRGEAAP